MARLHHRHLSFYQRLTRVYQVYRQLLKNWITITTTTDTTTTSTTTPTPTTTWKSGHGRVGVHRGCIRCEDTCGVPLYVYKVNGPLKEVSSSIY